MVRAYQQLYQTNPRTRLKNQARLRAITRDHADSVWVFNSHDPIYLEMAQAIERTAERAARETVQASQGEPREHESVR